MRALFVFALCAIVYSCLLVGRGLVSAQSPCNVTADCAIFDTDCADGTCVMSVCVQVPKMDGLACTPTDLCFLAGLCLSGSCSPTVAKNCDDGNQCTADACISPSGVCVNDPGPLNGDSCDDSDACTGDDVCDAGACVGIPIDCSGLDDQCNNGVCNTGSGECEAVPIADTTACLLPFPCIENTTCTAGLCAGFPKDCNDDNECTTDLCVVDQVDPDIGVCHNFWNTIECLVTDPCIQNAVCFEGDCSGENEDCTEFDSECTVGVCTALYDPPALPPPIPFPPPPPPPPPPGNGTNGTKRGWEEYGEAVLTSVSHTVVERMHVCNVPLPGVANPECALDWIPLPGPGGAEIVCSLVGSNPCDDIAEAQLPGSNFCRQTRCKPTQAGVGSLEGICEWRCRLNEDPKECNHGTPCLEWGFCWQGFCAVECAIDAPQCANQTIPHNLGFPAEVFTPVCTQDLIDNGTPCQGTSPCVSGYLCLNGICTATDLVDCDDGIDCTIDYCIDAPLNMSGGCQHVLTDALCDDGINCTADSCQGLVPVDGGCLFTPVDTVCPPAPPGSECIASVCSPLAGCVLLYQDSLCTDAITCNGQETCNNVTGLCEDAPPLDCDDGNECTMCTCVEPAGCECPPVPNFTPCVNASDPCTSNPQCIGSVCFGQDPKDCSAFDSLCGVGACDSGTPTGECFTQNFTENTPCDDNDVCNGRELCDAGGVCQPGTPLDCTNPNQCIITSCHPVDGCQSQQSVGPCEDGDLCTTGEMCDGIGNCVGGVITDCSFLDLVCMVGVCNPTNGACELVPGNENQPCDDGLTCTVSDVCQSGVCTPIEMLDCDDRNPCTLDTCVEPGGCVHTLVPDGTSCADPNRCNGDEVCMAGQCQSGTPVVCPPTGDVCISNQCNPDTGLCEMLGDPIDVCGDCGGGVVDPELCARFNTFQIAGGVILILLGAIAILLLAKVCLVDRMHVMNNANIPELRRETVFHKEGVGRVEVEIGSEEFEIPLTRRRKQRKKKRTTNNKKEPISLEYIFDRKNS